MCDSSNILYTKTNYSIFIKVKKRVLFNMEIGYARVSTRECWHRDYDCANLRDDLEDAAKEVQLHKGGKDRLQTLDEFLNDV